MTLFLSFSAAHTAKSKVKSAATAHIYIRVNDRHLQADCGLPNTHGGAAPRLSGAARGLLRPVTNAV